MWIDKHFTNYGKFTLMLKKMQNPCNVISPVSNVMKIYSEAGSSGEHKRIPSIVNM